MPAKYTISNLVIPRVNTIIRVPFTICVALVTLVWCGNISAGMDPNPIKAGIGGLIMFSLLLAWTYWINRLRPTRA